MKLHIRLCSSNCIHSIAGVNVIDTAIIPWSLAKHKQSPSALITDEIAKVHKYWQSTELKRKQKADLRIMRSIIDKRITDAQAKDVCHDYL